MKQTIVNLTVKLVVNHDIDIEEVISNMDYDFSTDWVPGAEIIDSEITGYEVVDPNEFKSTQSEESLEEEIERRR